MPASWDLFGKDLLYERPQDFATLALPGSRFIRRCESQYQIREIRLDRLIEVEDQHGQHVLVNVELQASQDGKLPPRLAVYDIAAMEDYKIPIMSYVIYLQKVGPGARPPWCLSEVGGRCWHWIDCLCLELAEKTTEELRQMNLLGLLPLFILSKDGRNFEVLDEVIRRLSEANEPALLVITRLFAEVAFPSDEEKAEITRRFAMLRDIETTPTYQRLVRQGLEQARRQDILDVVQARFPSLRSLAEKQSESITDVEFLRQVLIQMSISQTEEAARQYLQGLHEPAA